jgi:hypothetical protein
MDLFDYPGDLRMSACLGNSWTPITANVGDWEEIGRGGELNDRPAPRAAGRLSEELRRAMADAAHAPRPKMAFSQAELPNDFRRVMAAAAASIR